MFIPPERTPLTAAAYLDRARDWARVLEDREAARSGLPVRAARPVVARKTGIAAGTLENLRRGRLKIVAVHWYERLRAGIIAELEQELRHVEFELQTARQIGLDPSCGETHALLASRQKIREALGLTDTPPAGDAGT